MSEIPANHNEKDRDQPTDIEEQIMPDWLNLIEPQIRGLLDLPDGWNGPGSCAINRDTLTTLLEVLARLRIDGSYLPQLVPLTSGGVQAEWHFFEQRIEIGVEVDGELFAFVRYGNNHELTIEITRDSGSNVAKQLNSQLHALSQAKSTQEATASPSHSPQDELYNDS